MQNQLEIFISYSHHDGTESARSLSDALEHRGFRVFIDQVVLRTGDEIDKKILPQIRAAILYIPLVTPGFCNPDRWAFREYLEALEEEKRRFDNSDQSSFVFPIMHGIVDHNEKVITDNKRLSEDLKRRRYERLDNFPSLVNQIVAQAGVQVDCFSRKKIQNIFGGIFPVTNIEYRRFIMAGGYTNRGVERWWSASGKSFWFSYAARVKHKFLWNVRTEDQPIDENLTGSNVRFNRFNQPVTGVCYFEAEAYCVWASEMLLKDKDRVIRLPTEKEWLSLLARHQGALPRGLVGLKEGSANLIYVRRVVSDRNAFDLEVAANIKYPSHFGEHPKTVSHAGCFDLIGNVWEWALDFEDPKIAKKNTRRAGNIGKILGNCCFDTPDRVKQPPMALRYPGYRHHVIGFRVVDAPQAR
jgi:formylglycine-generating enzyme required for sulfatase activity